jgi:hypothetical protein
VLHVPSAAALSRVLVASALALLALAGCGDLEQAAAAGGARNDLAGDLAAQLGGSASLTYEASYQLSGGKTAMITQAQSPTRSAYVYPGGKVIVSSDATTRCEPAGKTLTCTMTAPATPTSPPPPALFTNAGKSGMALPDTVLSLLNAASLDTDKTVEQHDTTIAGHHATCLRLAGVAAAEASRFTVCITSEGVLGSFTGTVSGAPVDAAMTHYSDRIEAGAFEPPPGAKLVDQRGR